METIDEALNRIALDIARLDYSGAKWIRDKQIIADSFTKRVFSNDCGALVDPHNGVTWVVYKGLTQFLYQKAN